MAEPPAEDPQTTAALSVVIKDESAKTRRLPCIYIGTAELFAERDQATVLAQLPSIAERLKNSGEQSTYSVTACRFEGHHGIYVRDVFNRSTFRRKLKALGMTFDEDPFVTFTAAGRFSAPQMGEFDLDFVIASDRDEEDDSKVISPPAALTAFLVASYRIGLVPQEELPKLIAALSKTVVLGSGAPEPLVEKLTAELSSRD